MKTILILTFAASLPLFADGDILKELEKAQQERTTAAEQCADVKGNLTTLKLAVENQQNVVRQKKLILEGKDPSIAAQEIRAKKPKRTVIWNYKLENRRELHGDNGLPKGLTYVKDGDRNVFQAASEKRGRVVSVRFFNSKEIELMRGKKVELSVMVKGKNIKGMASFKMWGTRPKPKNDIWPDAHIGQGTFEWRKASFTTEIPQDIRSLAFILGMENGSGEVRFKDLKIEVID